jgi:hypothetical protein
MLFRYILLYYCAIFISKYVAIINFIVCICIYDKEGELLCIVNCLVGIVVCVTLYLLNRGIQFRF